MASILITGGSGLIGRVLTDALLSKGHTVRHLTRAHRTVGPIRTFLWNVTAGTLDRAALEGADHIIHLAGAGITDKRWTTGRVRELIDSRTASAHLLLRCAIEQGARIKSFISAAGIGYYGARTTSQVFLETDAAGTDTIARISHEWEVAVDAWSTHTRVVKLRTPVVLSPTGGALSKLTAPVRWGLGAAFGSGIQWMPWVHIDDLVQVYTQAVEDDRFIGTYNVNTGTDVTNAEFMRTTARVLRRPFFLPNVPGLLLKAALGKMSSVLLEGSRASNAKLLGTGFKFEHLALEPALGDLLRK